MRLRDYPLSIICLALLSGFVSLSHGESLGDTLSLPEEERNVILRQTAMPELDQGRLGNILTRYYLEGLGGPEHWEQIESLKVAGMIELESGEFELNAYQKKPHFIKMTIEGNGHRLNLGYDGKMAWQDLPGDGQGALPMGEIEARRFIHSSHFGNHLLYPYAEGKTITYVDTVPVEGTICHQIRVELDTEYQVDYFIDIRTYLEIKVHNADLKNGTTNSVLYKDYIREFGMPIAKQVESFENGEWVSSLTVDEIKVNSGVMPWMFRMR